MTRLSDTQAIILSAAAQRPDRNLLPLPGSLRGGAATKVVGALLSRGLIREQVTDSVAQGGRGHEHDLAQRAGRPRRPASRHAGRARGDRHRAGAPIADTAAVEPAPKKRGQPRKAAATGADAAPAPKTRDGTKQAQVIAMLRRKQGATIAQIVEATGLEATHRPRLLRRGAEEEAGLDRHLREGRGQRAGLPHQRLTTGRPSDRAAPQGCRAL